jgi:hypothetical protein
VDRDHERTQVNEFWSKPVDKGHAVVRMAQALGQWIHFKEWVLEKL